MLLLYCCARIVVVLPMFAIHGWCCCTLVVQIATQTHVSGAGGMILIRMMRHHHGVHGTIPTRMHRHHGVHGMILTRMHHHHGVHGTILTRMQHHHGVHGMIPTRMHHHHDASVRGHRRQMSVSHARRSVDGHRRRMFVSHGVASHVRRWHLARRLDFNMRGYVRGACSTVGFDPASSQATCTLAQEFKHEQERLRRKNEAMFAKANAEMQGAGAKTVYRDKHGMHCAVQAFAATGTLTLTMSTSCPGRKVDKEAEVAKQLAIAKGLDAKKQAESYMWNTGVAQKRLAIAQAEHLAKEAAKPLARYADDADRDALLKSRVRADDPMAAMLVRAFGCTHGAPSMCVAYNCAVAS